MASEWVSYVHKSARGVVIAINSRRVREGDDVREFPPGIAAFSGHVFTTNDPKMIKALDKHHQYGRTFQRIATAEDYHLIKRWGKDKIAQYMRGAATTQSAAKPVGLAAHVRGAGPTVSQGGHTVATDETTISEAVGHESPTAAKRGRPIKRTSKKRATKKS